jgi:hypothetical protein
VTTTPRLVQVHPCAFEHPPGIVGIVVPHEISLPDSPHSEKQSNGISARRSSQSAVTGQLSDTRPPVCQRRHDVIRVQDAA